jgi:hypothetical protein
MTTLKQLRLTEQKKLIGSYNHPTNGSSARVYHHTGQDDDGDPYHVRYFERANNGKQKENKDAEYFTNDEDDAHGTAKSMVKDTGKGTPKYESVNESGEQVSFKHPRTGRPMSGYIIGEMPQDKHLPKHEQRVHVNYQKGTYPLTMKRSELTVKPFGARPVKEEVLVEGMTPMQVYNRNEDNNFHSKNMVHMAKHVGDEEDMKVAKGIVARHNKEGHLSDENGEIRSALNKKLWPKFVAKFGKKD